MSNESENIITCTTNKTMIETDCKFEHDGKVFEAGGSCIWIDPKTQRHKALMYQDAKNNQVKSWDGSLKIPAQFGRVWRGVMGDERQHVTFAYEGIKYSGIWYKGVIGWDIVKATEIRGRAKMYRCSTCGQYFKSKEIRSSHQESLKHGRFKQ